MAAIPHLLHFLMYLHVSVHIHECAFTLKYNAGGKEDRFVCIKTHVQSVVIDVPLLWSFGVFLSSCVIIKGHMCILSMG